MATKKMKKRLLAMLTAFAVVCGLMPENAFAEGNNLLVCQYSETFDIPEGNCGIAIDTIDVSEGVSGGTAPYTYQLKEDSPDWLTIDNGQITGTRPDTEQDATTATIMITDSSKPAQTGSITISVGAVKTIPVNEPEEVAATEETEVETNEAAEETEVETNEAVEEVDDENAVVVEETMENDTNDQDSTATTTISGTVIWVNRNRQASSQRPTSSTVRLFANNVYTKKYVTVTASDDSTGTAFSFPDQPTTDDSGNVIVYTVSQDTIDNYETMYSTDTLTITNSYIGGLPKTSHTFGHIDVRIAGASLEINYLTKDAGGNVIARSASKITAYVTKVESVTMSTTSGTRVYTGFSKSGNYEFRKLNGVAISSQTLNTSSTATLIVDLVDANGKTYDNVSVTYGLGGIMEAAYNCDGYGNGSFDGLDFIVGDAQNYTVEMTSYGLGISIDKKVKEGSGQAQQFSGKGGEFTFDLIEYSGTTATGRSWSQSNDANGKASIVITYPYSSSDELKAYAGKTYTYILSEKTGTLPGYYYDDTVYTFTVKFTLDTSNSSNIVLKPVIQEEVYADGTFSFENLIMKNHSVTINKVDEQGKKIDGAEFTIYSDEKCTNAVKSFYAGSYSLSTGDPELAPYLPTSGNISTLFLKETDPADGYELNGTLYIIEMRYSDLGYLITVDDTSSITVTNKRITDTATVHGSVTINKVDESGNALTGATFTVYADKECTKSVTTFPAGSYKLSTENDDLKDYLPESGSSKALYLKETTPPDGYTGSDTIYTVTISAKEDSDWNADHSKYVTTTTYTMKIGDADSLDVTNKRITTSTYTSSAASPKKKVMTGDHAAYFLWIGMICLAVIAAILTMLIGLKKNK